MKRLIGLILLICMAASLVACGSSEEKQDTTKSADKTVAVEIDDTEIYLDEAKYYLYSTQATYEVYYMSKNKEINWNKKHGKTTMEDVAKGASLDKICRMTCFASLKKDYNVEIDSEAKEEIKKKADTYYTSSDENLKAKIDIKKARLMKLFEKEYIAETIEDIMNTTESGSADKYYSKWMKSTDVECMECWQKITFKDHIFTKDRLGQSDENDQEDNGVDNGNINVNEEEQQ